jgi:hypothetical protein
MDLGSLPTIINNVPCIPLPSKDQILDNTFYFQISRSLHTLRNNEYKNIVWESAHLREGPSVHKRLLGDSEHNYLAILESGTSTWNRWRAASEDVLLDFSGANLSYLDLHGANLQSANLQKVKFTQTDLRQASLVDSNLSGVDLAGANLTEADLRGATLYDAILTNTNLERTVLGGTILASIDLRTASGLDLCIHQGPSAIDFATLSKSGNISKQFLLGAGLPQGLIEHLPALLESAIHYYSCFLSYATANEDFVRRLHADLQSLGIRSWYAPHELRLGERLWDQLDEAIRVHDKLVLVLSSESIRSGWVQREVEKALSTERETHKTVLFPVLVDDTVFKTSGSWASAVKDRMMADFRDWREERSYTQALSRLVKALTVTAATETLERA